MSFILFLILALMASVTLNVALLEYNYFTELVGSSDFVYTSNN